MISVRKAGEAPAIDLVYTWVDGTDSAFCSGLHRFAVSEADRNPERYRDIHQCLRFSLRSVDRFAPWIRRIHIVSNHAEPPEWLDVSLPRIRFHPHETFLPESVLPTFNPRVIQSFLHLLPDSAEHLLYLNDDFFFGAPVEREDFLREGGRIVLYGTHFGIPLGFRVYAQKNQVKGFPYLEHTPLLVRKSLWREMLEAKPEALERTRSHRFRRADDLRMDRLYRWFLLSRRRPEIEVVPFWKLRRIHRFHRVTNDIEQQERGLQCLREQGPKFFCLNDNQGEQPDPRVVERVHALLGQWFPGPSPFEVMES